MREAAYIPMTRGLTGRDACATGGGGNHPHLNSSPIEDVWFVLNTAPYKLNKVDKAKASRPKTLFKVTPILKASNLAATLDNKPLGLLAPT